MEKHVLNYRDSMRLYLKLVKKERKKGKNGILEHMGKKLDARHFPNARLSVLKTRCEISHALVANFF